MNRQQNDNKRPPREEATSVGSTMPKRNLYYEQNMPKLSKQRIYELEDGHGQLPWGITSLDSGTTSAGLRIACRFGTGGTNFLRHGLNQEVLPGGLR